MRPLPMYGASSTDTEATRDPKYVKVLDQSRCIGCHACTTACKSENEVPLSVTRTYVKAVDVGEFPDARRNFQVTRCNQCEDAPCVNACPTKAMFVRPDGIVDFDKDSCIGCKACIAACPEGILIKGRAGTPKVALMGGACTFCGRCAEACEEGVFNPTSQTPWFVVAAISDGCLLNQNVTCQSCTDACDEAALQLDYRQGRLGSITIREDLCTGCGACLGVCPVSAIALVTQPEGKAA